MQQQKNTETLAKKYTNFLNNSISPHHCIDFIKKKLQSENIHQIYNLNDMMSGKFFNEKNNSIFLLSVPKNPKFTKIILTHSDSPVLKVKPDPFGKSSEYDEILVEPYGGGLFHTWYDRPLKICGAFYNENMERQLFKSKSTVTIPSLPPHLNDGKVYNKGFHYLPTFSAFSPKDTVSKEVQKLKYLDFDFMLCNSTKAEYDNITKLIFSGKHDNLSSTFCALEAFSSSVFNKHSKFLEITAIFDFEEIGSEKHTGARTNIINEILGKYSIDRNKSIIISADAAHTYNPNYPGNYDANTKAFIGKGVAVKYSPLYSTTFFTSSFIMKLCKKFSIAYQKYSNSNLVRGGCTVGNMVSCQLNIQSVDIGIPIFGMHSCIESCSATDVESLIELFCYFFSGESDFLFENF